MSFQSTAAAPKLPFWATVGRCYATVFRNFGQLLRISWLWLLIMLPLYAIVHGLTWSPAMETAAPEGGILALIISFLPNAVEFPVLASIAVAWHRLVLREEAVRGPFYLRLDSVVWRYALILLVFFVLVAAPFVAATYSGISAALLDPKMSLSAAATPGAVATVIICLAATLAIAGFLLPRLSLMLPAIALGESLSAAAAWRVSGGNTWRLLWATLLCSVPLYVLLFAPVAMYFRDETQASAALVGTIGSLISVLIVTVGVTLLSLSYRHFARQGDVGGSVPQPGEPAAA